MDLGIRNWTRDDVAAIGELWLGALREADVGDLSLHPDAEGRLHRWLLDRVRERSVLGLVAEWGGEFAGFVLGRVGRWEASPSITHEPRMGVIDVVCVVPARRRRGIATRLISEVSDRMRARGARRIDTHWRVEDAAASAMWASLGFAPTLERGRRDFPDR